MRLVDCILHGIGKEKPPISFSAADDARQAHFTLLCCGLVASTFAHLPLFSMFIVSQNVSCGERQKLYHPLRNESRVDLENGWFCAWREGGFAATKMIETRRHGGKEAQRKVGQMFN